MTKIIFILNVLALSNAYTLELTQTTLGFTIEPKLMRAFHTGIAYTSFGSITMNNRFTMRAGFSVGMTDSVFDMKVFVKAEAALPIKAPLMLSLHYRYNGLLEYKTHIQSVLPMVFLNGRWAGIGLGFTWYFTIFNREPVIIEPVLAFSGYVNFYNTEKGRIGLQCANMNDFASKNMGAYSLTLGTQITVTTQCFIINEFTLYQAGSVGLAANFYGIAYRGGLLFRW
ncbi:MAG: hypothetical protein LBD29_02935 [Treponema sp.]|jgi:hypothetical protein|nr:hypothetical protein [Treponema sp.]